ncbi:MAG: hypothetical protein DRI57_13730 [Deltaproteobacteria bacterium]|nr:MAG: hypothetical protein DRI57_13730 [Deltaproteobacteria bacterium]
MEPPGGIFAFSDSGSDQKSGVRKWSRQAEFSHFQTADQTKNPECGNGAARRILNSNQGKNNDIILKGRNENG